jgi:hypothetical protein
MQDVCRCEIPQVGPRQEALALLGRQGVISSSRSPESGFLVAEIFSVSADMPHARTLRLTLDGVSLAPHAPHGSGSRPTFLAPLVPAHPPARRCRGPILARAVSYPPCSLTWHRPRPKMPESRWGSSLSADGQSVTTESSKGSVAAGWVWCIRPRTSTWAGASH